ncbi:MAG TPA: hypothetical protein VJ124_16920 [Pyrinomonadaceae bacterium]|nr:hypothetical protein [Pyrinomonadaceae bacterium]
MSSESDQARLVAERIARRLARVTPTEKRPAYDGADLASELAALRESLGEFQRRLTQIESRVRAPTSGETNPALSTHSPWLAGVNGTIDHPSQERFGVEEATVAELVDYFQQEKQCSIDPSGKPCDHCAMCSSRGF